MIERHISQIPGSPTQQQIASSIAKHSEYLSLAAEQLQVLVGKNPFPVPAVYAGLCNALTRLQEAQAIVDLLLLVQDEEKKRKEAQGRDINKKKEQFRKIYNADSENKKKQTWEDYWKWVKDFYICKPVWGNPRWLDMVDDLLDGFAEEVTNEKRKKLDAIGERIAGDWSKDNSVRKIGTSDLKKWGKRIKKAKKKDRGDGKQLNKTLDDIKKEINDKLK